MARKRRNAKCFPLAALAALAAGVAFPVGLRAAGHSAAGMTAAQQVEVQRTVNSSNNNDQSNQVQSQNYGSQNGGGPNGGGPNGGDQNWGGPNGGDPNAGDPNAGGQSEDGQDPFHPGGGAAPGGKRAAPADASDDGAPRAPDPELTLDDAREDFQTIVESFLLKHSDGGAWKYSDPHGRKRALALVKVETSTVARVSARRYAGLVRLRDVGTGKTTRLRFTVDLSGDNWKVVSYAEPPPAKKSAARR